LQKGGIEGSAGYSPDFSKKFALKLTHCCTYLQAKAVWSAVLILALYRGLFVFCHFFWKYSCKQLILQEAKRFFWPSLGHLAILVFV